MENQYELLTRILQDAGIPTATTPPKLQPYGDAAKCPRLWWPNTETPYVQVCMTNSTPGHERYEVVDDRHNAFGYEPLVVGEDVTASDATALVRNILA